MGEINPVSIINKTVSIKDVSLLEFMYPWFIVKDDIFFDYENDIIYVGKQQGNTKGMLEKGTRNFISTVGVYDIDLDDRNTKILVLYSKWNKMPSEKVLDILIAMSDDDFMKYFKKYWVLGSSKLDGDSDVSIFDLYKCLGKSKHDIFKTYLKLSEIYEDGYILSSLLSFIEKAYNPDIVSSSSGRYLQMLKDFSKDMGVSIKPILYSLYTMKADRSYKLLWLLNRLGKGDVV